MKNDKKTRYRFSLRCLRFNAFIAGIGIILLLSLIMLAINPLIQRIGAPQTFIKLFYLYFPILLIFIIYIIGVIRNTFRALIIPLVALIPLGYDQVKFLNFIINGGLNNWNDILFFFYHFICLCFFGEIIFTFLIFIYESIKKRDLRKINEK